MADDNESIYTLLMKADDELDTYTSDNKKITKDEITAARELMINYFALGESEAKQLKQLMRSKNSYKAFLASNALSGTAGGVVGHIVSIKNISATIGSVVPVVGTTIGYGIGWAIEKIPGINIIKDGFLGAVSGCFIGSAVYILHATKSKWTSLGEVQNYMNIDLNAWELDHLKTKPIELQHAAEILTSYLRQKNSSKMRLLLVSWKGIDSDFYLTNAFVKMILMLISYMDNMPSLMVQSLLIVIEYDLNDLHKKNKINSQFLKKFKEFKEIIDNYLKKRLFEETVVEKLGRTLVLGYSAITPILPWIYACFKGDDKNIYMYDPEKFKMVIENEALSTKWSKFWSDLNLAKVKEIKDTKKQDLDTAKKKLGKMNELIKSLNNSILNNKANEEIPNEQEISKTERKISKLMEYAEAFQDFTKYNEVKNKNKIIIKDQTLDRIRKLNLKIITKDKTRKTDDMWMPRKALQYIYQWWISEETNYKKTREVTGKIRLFENIRGNKPNKIEELTQDEIVFKNIISNAFEINSIFKSNAKLRAEFSQKKDDSKANKYAHKIESFCELITYAQRLGEFMSENEDKNKFSVYSFFGLWAIYNIIIDNYSTQIPDSITKFYKNRNLVNDINGSNYLKKFLVLPYDTFKKILIPGFNEKFLNNNSNDFFRVFIYYYSNIINSVTEIQYHIEALKKCKMLLAMFGEIDSTLISANIPLFIINELLLKIQNLITQYSKHIKSLQEIEDEKKKKSWSNMIGLYNVFWGKDTGFYENFENKFKNINTRIKLFKESIIDTNEHIEYKVKHNIIKERGIDEDLAKKIEPFYKDTFIYFLEYILAMKSIYKEKFRNINEKEIEMKINVLKDRYLFLTDNKDFLSGTLPVLKAPPFVSGLMTSYSKIEKFILNFYESSNYEIPNEILKSSTMENSKKETFRLITKFLRYPNESTRILNKCIELVRMDKEVAKISFNIFEKFSIFDDVRDYPHEAMPEFRIVLFSQILYNYETFTGFKMAFTEKKIYKNIVKESLKKSMLNFKNDDDPLFKESGLIHIQNDSLDDISDDLSKELYYVLLRYIIIYTFMIGPASPEFIKYQYVGKQSKFVENRFYQSVWGLFGMCLAYLFNDTRSKAEKVLTRLNDSEKLRKSEEDERIVNRNKMIIEKQKENERKRKELENREKELQNREKMIESKQKDIRETVNNYQRAEIPVYNIILQAIRNQITRLANTSKGEKLMIEVNKLNREIMENWKDKDDRENTIKMLKGIKPILNEHRGFFAIGKTQAYKEVLEVAKIYNIKEVDIK